MSIQDVTFTPFLSKISFTLAMMFYYKVNIFFPNLYIKNMTHTFKKKIESWTFKYSSGNKIQISHLNFAAILFSETKLITKISQKVVQPINSGVGLKTHKVQYKYAMHHFYSAAM
jgi:hypothetical protein